MHKKIISSHIESQTLDTKNDWLNIEQLAQVELSSENQNYPIESALLPDGDSAGWRAADAGEQIIRIIFNEPQQIEHILLSFTESENERTQEYQLNWYSSAGQAYEIVRQQWTFSPNGSTSEVENHYVSLTDAKMLELRINPDISSNAIASLEKLRIS